VEGILMRAHRNVSVSVNHYRPGTNLWARVVRLEEQLLGRDGKQDYRRTIQRAHTELDQLYPGLANGNHPQHRMIVDALLLADTNGGRVPITTPPLGPTCEALVRRDRSVTLPREKEREYDG
jgi:hypothetical protein